MATGIMDTIRLRRVATEPELRRRGVRHVGSSVPSHVAMIGLTASAVGID